MMLAGQGGWLLQTCMVNEFEVVHVGVQSYIHFPFASGCSYALCCLAMVSHQPLLSG